MPLPACEVPPQQPPVSRGPPYPGCHERGRRIARRTSCDRPGTYAKSPARMMRNYALQSVFTFYRNDLVK